MFHFFTDAAQQFLRNLTFKENKLPITWVHEWILFFFRRKYSAPFRDIGGKHVYLHRFWGCFELKWGWTRECYICSIARFHSSDRAGLMVAVTLRNSQGGSVYCIRWIERYLQLLVFMSQSSEESINVDQEIKCGPSLVIHRKVYRFTRFVFVHIWSQLDHSCTASHKLRYLACENVTE